MKKVQPRSKKSKTKAKPAAVRAAAPTPTAPPPKERKAQTPVPAPPSVAPDQPDLFEKGIALFRQARFAEARGFFEKAAEGPILEMASSARAHARMCALRIDRAAPALTTAEDYYNWGVAFLNQRRLREAEAHLEEALRLAPEGDHIHYALALSRGLGGDVQRASQNLKRAIELRPRNRGQARHDPDFAGLLHQPPIAALLLPDNEPDNEDEAAELQ
jgi:tetratricopeptide (TPR) repeat protein